MGPYKALNAKQQSISRSKMVSVEEFGSIILVEC
jgi:hypothetical protein